MISDLIETYQILMALETVDVEMMFLWLGCLDPRATVQNWAIAIQDRDESKLSGLRIFQMVSPSGL